MWRTQQERNVRVISLIQFVNNIYLYIFFLLPLLLHDKDEYQVEGSVPAFQF